jgi:predicted TPR repeat methyltransferase
MSEYFNSQSKTWDQHQYRINRAQIVATAIKKAIPLSSVGTLLDFGCGTGLLGLNFIAYAKHVILADNSEGMIEQVEQKLHTQSIMNAGTLHLRKENLNSSYDLIVSLMALHHIKNVEDQIAQLSSSVKSGGYICLCDLDKEDGSFHQEEIVPHNGFERDFIEKNLKKNGLEVIESSTVFINRKKINNEEREFSIFMLIGRRN